MSYMVGTVRAGLSTSEKERLTEDEIVGQMACVNTALYCALFAADVLWERLLVVAGTETTSSGLCQILQLMAQYPDMQDKLRGEIVQAQAEHGFDIPYNVLVDLPYMDAICRESLRL